MNTPARFVLTDGIGSDSQNHTGPFLETGVEIDMTTWYLAIGCSYSLVLKNVMNESNENSI